jgi:hypothetical protein
LYTINFELPLHYHERGRASCPSSSGFFLFLFLSSTTFAVLFCGENDSFLAGDGAREWASRHGLATETVDGEVEKVRNALLCTCISARVFSEF